MDETNQSSGQGSESETSTADDLGVKRTNEVGTDGANGEVDENAQLLKRAEEAEKKAADVFNRHLYLQAEFENYKKRMDRERTELIKYSSERAISEFLPVIDHLQFALESARSAKDTKAVIDGIEMTTKNLIGIFEALGCQFIDSLGQPFDPSKHEAVMHKESADVEKNTVLQEFQRGCLLNGRLIRPAKVVVSKGKETSA